MTEQNDESRLAHEANGQARAFDVVATVGLIGAAGADVVSVVTKGPVSDGARKVGLVALLVTLGAAITAATKHAQARSFTRLTDHGRENER